ncbi:MAG: GNAT family N-acetyltransferase [Proteobacteria bacterium]|nr:GNAT family N-acetyltransferase [Pseudomonadota bacterium]
MRPTDRAALARLGHTVFARFGRYEGALAGWLRHTQVRTVVAQADGRAIGFAMVGPVPDADGGTDAYLLALGVDESARRQGIGRDLLNAAVEEARKGSRRWGTDQLRLDVADDNVAAIALFRAAGFEDASSGETYAGGQSALSMVLPLV